MFRLALVCDVDLADNAASPCSDNGTLQSSHTDVAMRRSVYGLLPVVEEGEVCASELIALVFVFVFLSVVGGGGGWCPLSMEKWFVSAT